MVLGMLALAAAIYYSVNADQEPAVVTPTVQVEDEQPPSPPPATKSKQKSKPKKQSTKPKTPKSTPPPPPRKTKPASPPAPAGEFEVAFRSMGAEAKLQCGDGQTGRFVGTTRRKFTDVTSCLITIDGKKGAVQVKRSSTVSCKVSGSSVSCSGA